MPPNTPEEDLGESLGDGRETSAIITQPIIITPPSPGPPGPHANHYSQGSPSDGGRPISNGSGVSGLLGLSSSSISGTTSTAAAAAATAAAAEEGGILQVDGLPSRSNSISSGKKIIRWVGLHGGHTEGHEVVPGKPNTPHIILSQEDQLSTTDNQETPPQETNGENNNVVAIELQDPKAPTPVQQQQQQEQQPQNETSQQPPEVFEDIQQVKNVQPLSNPITSNGMATPVASTPTSPLLQQDQKPQFPDSSLLTMEGLMPRKTRRNSMCDMLQRVNSQNNLHRIASNQNLRRASSKSSLMPSIVDWKVKGNDALLMCLSALYGKLIVVMGMAFPMAEVISSDIPVTFYNGFYLYLYVGSIFFLLYIYMFLLRTTTLPSIHLRSKFQSLRSYIPLDMSFRSWPLSVSLSRRGSEAAADNPGRMASRDSRFSTCSERNGDVEDKLSVNTLTFHKHRKYTITESSNHGSMYLKMGAMLFGIGSMIYSGLEVGQYFELKSDEDCADVLLAISPAARMLFTFIQMYFIFLNSRVAISKHRTLARFGLMHMIGTNLCIWLNVLVQETKHEIINLTYGHGHGGHGGGHEMPQLGNVWAQIMKDKFNSLQDHSDHAVLDDITASSASAHHHIDIHPTAQPHTSIPHVTATTPMHHIKALHEEMTSNDSHSIVTREVNAVSSIFECRRSDLMGQLVDNASPFLFPCTIEYSLLCAGVLYVMWKNINQPNTVYEADSDISTYTHILRKTRHHYSVDCAHANRGLFAGILILVLTIISLILFFVLINNNVYKELAILEANIIELSVYSVTIVTLVVGMIQMKELEFIPEGDIELDNILLLIAQTGVYIYTSFTIIGGHFTMQVMQENLILPLITAIITLTQTTLQTIFILDASRRCCCTQDQFERKPGREMVTFLLVCNLAMWAINTFETSRADAHPTQLHFYGIWAWTIISHVSMPLAIFYRFHVTVCLCEIWKRSYKMRHEYM